MKHTHKETDKTEIFIIEEFYDRARKKYRKDLFVRSHQNHNNHIYDSLTDQSELDENLTSQNCLSAVFSLPFKKISTARFLIQQYSPPEK